MVPEARSLLVEMEGVAWFEFGLAPAWMVALPAWMVALPGSWPCLDGRPPWILALPRLASI